MLINNSYSKLEPKPVKSKLTIIKDGAKTRENFFELLDAFDHGEKNWKKINHSYDEDEDELCPVRYTRKEFENAPKTKEQLISIIKPVQLSEKEFKQKLAKLGALCSRFNYFGDLTILNLAQTEQSVLGKIFRNKTTISRVIKYAEKCGLIKCVDKSFSKKKHRSMKYLWNIQVKRLILDLVDEHGINKFNSELMCRAATSKNYMQFKTELVEDESVEKFGKKDFVEKTFNVDFSAGLSIAGCSDEQANILIHKKYPQIAHYQKMVDRDNEKYLTSDPNDRMHQSEFQPKIKRRKDGCIGGISIRETNDFCKLWSKENFIKRNQIAEYDVPERDGKNRLWREDYVREYFHNKGIDEWSYFDQKASIFTLNKYKQTGVWHEGDMYENLIGDSMSKDERSLYKKIFTMRAMFDWSYQTIAAKFRQLDSVKEFNKKHSDKRCIIDGKVFEYSDLLIKHFTERLQNVMHNTKKNTSIFLDESCIFIQLVHDLREKGWTVLHCYDGIWVGKKNHYASHDELQSALKKRAQKYFEKFYGIRDFSSSEITLSKNKVSEKKNSSYLRLSYKVVSLSPNGQTTPLLFNTHDHDLTSTDIQCELQEFEWENEELTVEQKEMIQNMNDMNCIWRSSSE